MAADPKVELAARAAVKQAAGEKLSRDEQRALAWQAKQTREAILNETLRQCAKGMYCQLAGRQQKVIDEQARRYALPMLGGSVDLFAAVKSLHDLIARNADSISVEGGPSLQVEKVREQVETMKLKQRLVRSEIARRRNEFIRRSDLKKLLAWLAENLRSFGETLGRSHGRKAQESLNKFLDRLASELEDSAAQ